MVNETTLVTKYVEPINFVCANATGIEKGAILKLADPVTASLSSGASDIIAGICASEKVASNGIVNVAVYRGGVFKVKLSGSCSVGDALSTSSTANHVNVSPTTYSGSKRIGYALETGATGDTILMEVNIGGA
jgi:hypothetical protein